MSPALTALLADADVLIDYRQSDFAVLALVVQHVGRLVVLPPVLDEVHGVTATACADIGIELIEVETELMLQAAEIEAQVSFNDRLCLVMCRENAWTCVTNDGALRRLCAHHGVETRFGLGLLVDLVAAGALTRARADDIARRIHVANPLHINERVLLRLADALDALARTAL